MTEAMKVGVIGTGAISGIYFQTGKRMHNMDIVACADLDLSRAKAKAEEFEVPRPCAVDELLNDPEIELVLNLTIPAAHAEVDIACLEAGKHVYSEKPLALNRDKARKILDLADSRGLRVGCAPDTFLGGGLQTCRKLIDDGWIGEPASGTAFMCCQGHETWHSDPEFYYQKGGGPVFDMGPYYITALINLLGPVKRVGAMTRKMFEKRVIRSEKKRGKVMDVEIPTHVSGLLEFVNGAQVTMIMSFDTFRGSGAPIALHGPLGSLTCTNPNSFGGQATYTRAWSKDPTAAPVAYGYIENSRGLGAADMISGIRNNREHRASGEIAYHALDVMQTLHEAADAGRTLELNSRCKRPAAMPLGLVEGAIE